MQGFRINSFYRFIIVKDFNILNQLKDVIDGIGSRLVIKEFKIEFDAFYRSIGLRL